MPRIIVMSEPGAEREGAITLDERVIIRGHAQADTTPLS